ncbi:hypothetical protein OROMI_009683 [Orobanche minor]
MARSGGRNGVVRYGKWSDSFSKMFDGIFQMVDIICQKADDIVDANKMNAVWEQVVDESYPHRLNIYLPGFKEEQIKVTKQGRNTFRVRVDTKSGYVIECFQVPDDGEMNLISTTFQGGTLTITIPKKKFEKSYETLTPKPKGNDVIMENPGNISHEASTSQPEDQKSRLQERQFPTNMGASMVVFVAFVAYITYKFAYWKG